jgi:hypothetical protein
VTRAQVRAELVQLEKSGYNPADSSDAHYPAGILAAESRVGSSYEVKQSTGYGPATDGASQSGQRGDLTQGISSPSVFKHH